MASGARTRNQYVQTEAVSVADYALGLKGLSLRHRKGIGLVPRKRKLQIDRSE